jgi:hypothetical protein
MAGVTPWGLAAKVEAAYQKAFDAIDDFNDASENDEPAKKVDRLGKRADEFMIQAVEMRGQLADLVDSYWSEYEWS